MGSRSGVGHRVAEEQMEGACLEAARLWAEHSRGDDTVDLMIQSGSVFFSRIDNLGIEDAGDRETALALIAGYALRLGSLYAQQQDPELGAVKWREFIDVEEKALFAREAAQVSG
ncbi:hypothetical protein QWM81_04975 [Streptomyces ficellus]|uniref:Uncharacterized protein n=1 Tax=Streptomyces ficellus TaxID=1977088 RepID=A0ABT7Z1R3_9ACTN|nr:hypothetical protein [Streptomyces ficellus]MDN3293401.1 hypothetical protein [Streptomyces ficellus]